MAKVLEAINAVVWGAPALILILGVGLYLSIKLGFPQVWLFCRALRTFFSNLTGKPEHSGVSPFQALCTALAATVGTGNLVGVAGAICLGGPGAVFWMWICGFLGMVTKFAEATLAVRYRVSDHQEARSGPMYMISLGMGEKWRFLAVLYSLFGVFAAFGVGNATQVNAVIGSVNGVIRSWGGQETMAGNVMMGLILAVLIGAMLLGGAKRIGMVAERLVPFVSGIYIMLCIGLLVVCRNQIAGAFQAIVMGAFSPKAVTGGLIGSAFSALRIGCSRGVFTNEAGMGTASIAHGAAQVVHPCQQGLMGIVEVFVDTIVICTLTALVILCSGVSIPFGSDQGANLTSLAFTQIYGEWAGVFLALALSCFAFATVLGWGLYGARCAEFLFGRGAWKWFALVQTGAVAAVSVLETGVIWSLAETVNGLMAIPNLIALAALSPELSRLTKEYRKTIENGQTNKAPK